jgi:hypothetical protein
VESPLSDATLKIIADLRGGVERMLNGNMPYKSFVVQKVTTQVVAGTRYVFTVEYEKFGPERGRRGGTIEVAVVQPLPHTNRPAYIESATVLDPAAAEASAAAQIASEIAKITADVKAAAARGDATAAAIYAAMAETAAIMEARAVAKAAAAKAAAAAAAAVAEKALAE